MEGNGRKDVYEMGAFSDPPVKDGIEKTSKTEKVKLIEKKHKVTPQTAIKLRYGAIAVSWISTIASLVLGIVALVFAAMYDNQSLFSFGLDSILDCASSVIVLWRFHGTNIYSEIKELRACIMIGVLFMLSALLLMIKCIHALLSTELAEKPKVALILSSVMFATCLVLGGSKVIIGYFLESRALVTDSIITLIGAAMSLLTLIFSVVYEHNKRLWFLDDTFGLLCSIFLLFYGVRVIWISRRDLKLYQPEQT